jgi:cell division protease FtsH
MPIHKATIIPRGRALGMVMYLPEKDIISVTREEYEARMISALGGRVAEEIIFGHDKVTSGASSDIQQVTKTAREMVTQFGMSETLGPILYAENDEEVFLGRSVQKHKNVSEETAKTIDSEIKKLVDKSYEKTKEILNTKIDDLHTLAKGLIEYETLELEEIKELLKTGTINRVRSRR